MTHPNTARTTALTTTPSAIPAQRATPTTSACGASAAEQPTGWAAARRALAIVRGLRSLGTVPARPQPSYGESDGQ